MNKLKLSAIVIVGFLMLVAGSFLFDKKESGFAAPIFESFRESATMENDSSTSTQGKSALAEEEAEIIKDPWLNGYPYRKELTITNSTSTVTSYQVKIVIDTSILVGNSKMQSDCDDVRFTTADGFTLIDYYVESGCNSTSTSFWAEVPSIASGNNTIYIYYGNASSTAASNGTNTFISFINHEAGNLSQWTGSYAGWSVASDNKYEGAYSALGVQSTATPFIYKTLDRYYTSVALSAKFYVDSIVDETQDNYGNVIGTQDTAYGVTSYIMPAHLDNGHLTYWTGTAWSNLPTDKQYVKDTWQKIEVAFDYQNNLLRWLYAIDGNAGSAAMKRKNNTIPDDWNRHWASFHYGSAGNKLYVDQIMLRNYIYPEPTASVGSEVQLITQAGTGATDWAWKAPAVGDLIKNGTSTNWVWTEWHDDNSGVIVPYSSSTDWTWYPQ